MAEATISTFDAILKEFYLGPIQEQLNNEIMVLQMFQKATVDWNGKIAVMPVHLGRNSGVEWADESGTLPTAGTQTYQDMRILSQFLYGRFQITGPAMAAAGKGGTNSFVGWMDGEMNRLVDDVKNVADRDSVSGGTIKGFIPEYFEINTAGAGPGPFTGAKSGVAYDGDFTCFAGVVTATVATWVRINILRGDTLVSVPLAAGTEIWVKGANSAAGTIDLYVNSNPAAVPALDAEVPATGDLSCPLVVQLSSVAPVNEAGLGGAPGVAGNGLYVATQAAKQAEGIYGNLANPTHFTIDRTTGAANSGAELQSTLVRGDITQTPAGAYTRPALTLQKIQGIMDEVILESGASTNMLIMNPRQRQMYTGLLQGTSAGNLYVSTDRAAKGDGGFLGLSYGGVPIQVSRHCGNGMILFLDTKTWKILELQSGQFADLDGAVLSRVLNKDSWEGFYRWYWNIVCGQPNRNAILCGVKLAP
tara:strand:- start:2003 stop:3430 length:1428 start_codon:yes stop_codon:yes gene_type:complete